MRVSPASPFERYADKPVIALTSPNCFSACDTFASALKVNRLAAIVGEGTGGGTGTPLVFDLPYSQHRFRYSVVRGMTADGQPIEGAGTLPDLVIEPTQAERAEGKDQQLLTALGELQRQISERSSDPVKADPVMLLNAVRSLGPIWMQEIEVSPTRMDELMLKRISLVDEL